MRYLPDFHHKNQRDMAGKEQLQSLTVFNEIKINSYLLIHVYSTKNLGNTQRDRDITQFLKTPVSSFQDLIEFCRMYQMYKPRLDASRFNSNGVFSEKELQSLVDNLANLGKLVDTVNKLIGM